MYRNRKKLICKIIVLFLMFSICFMCMSKMVFAGNGNMNVDAYENSSGAFDSLATEIMKIGLRVVRVVAAGVAVIALVSIGIKYMSAAPEGRAEYKKTLLIYILGLTLVVSGTEIIGMIADAVK